MRLVAPPLLARQVSAGDGTYRELAGDRERIAALEELERLTIELSAELRRPLTVFDVIRTAPDAGERVRRVALVRELRRPA